MIDFQTAKCIVEYGPGIGNITQALLKNIKTDAKILCFELNKDFCSFLDNKFKDKRLIVINDSAEKVDYYLKKYNLENIDYAISGIPFSLIEKENKKNIIRSTNNNLRQGGKFIVYQFSNGVKKYLDLYFNNVNTKLELRNLPPYFILACEKS